MHISHLYKDLFINDSFPKLSALSMPYVYPAFETGTFCLIELMRCFLAQNKSDNYQGM